MFGRKVSAEESAVHGTLGGRRVEDGKSTITVHVAGPPTPYRSGGEVSRRNLGAIGITVFEGDAALNALELNRAKTELAMADAARSLRSASSRRSGSGLTRDDLARIREVGVDEWRAEKSRRARLDARLLRLGVDPYRRT